MCIERTATPVTAGERLREKTVTPAGPYSRPVHDIVIVGAGTAGCVLASRLTENPDLSVLLIEAGPRSRKVETRIPAAFSKLYRSAVDWGDATVPQRELDNREIVFPRGRALGGSAVINAMMVLRGHPADYDAWAADGCPGMVLGGSRARIPSERPGEPSRSRTSAIGTCSPRPSSTLHTPPGLR